MQPESEGHARKRPRPEGRARKRPQRNRESEWKLSTGDDLENALRAAERLLHEAEERRRHEQNITYAIVSVIVATLLSLAASLVVVVEVVSFGQGARFLAATLSFIVAGAIFIYLFISLQRHRSSIGSDFILRLAVQASSMVNAALVDVSEREGWSYLRLETAKIRLSAFPLLEAERLPPARE
jgi:hypothetical protein